MDFENGEEAFRVIRWSPGIRGFRRYTNLRTMTRDGQLWFAALDVQKALGITKRACHGHRIDRLEGNTWGTTTAQWQGRGPRLLFISLTALTVATACRHHRLDRFFVRWLDSLEAYIRAVGLEEYVSDLPQVEDHSEGAYLKIAVEHAGEQPSMRLQH